MLHIFFFLNLHIICIFLFFYFVYLFIFSFDIYFHLLTIINKLKFQNREQFYPAQQSHETFENRNYNDAYTKPEIYNQAPKEPSYNVKTQPVAAPINNREYYDSPDNVNRSYEPKPVYQPNTPLTQRDLAYKPSIAQGWKSRPINLPTGKYIKI